MTTRQSDPPKRKRRWILRLCVISLILFLAAGYLQSSGCKAYEKASRIQCAGNLKQIMMAMEMYAEDFNGEYPDQGLWQLADDYLSPGKVYLCPTVQRHSERKRLTLADLKAGSSDYVYLAAPTPEARAAGLLPIVRDIASNHHPDHFTWWYRFRTPSVGPWIIVAFSNGSADGFEAESWEELAERECWSTDADDDKAK
ncbi:MAG: hypothetical protein ACI8W8_000993 [Rhodothermales bacterium]|jgi:hypothetical protein